ncbi:MAG TPA: PAS domain S-box protein [Steroidobacteraceae bacterium]
MGTSPSSAEVAAQPPADSVSQSTFIAQARLAAVVDSSDDAIVSKSLEGRIQSWNAAAERLFGYTAAEVIGKPIMIIVPPELQAEERQILERLKRGERIDHFDTVRLAKDGHRVPISLTVSPVRDSQGVIVGASKIARDVSERLRSERELRLTQGQLKAHADVLAKLNECTARLWSCHTLQSGLEEILNTVVKLLRADKGHMQLLDDRGEVLHIAAQVGFGPDFIHALRDVTFHNNSAPGRALRLRARVIIEDLATDPACKALRPLARAADYRAVVSTPLIGPDGILLGMLSTYFTAAHRPTEQELRSVDLFARHSCDFIRRCTMEQELRLREESLREGDRRKDEFLALLAHELRNPLAPVRYALATMRKPGLTSEQRARANEVIERQVGQMTHLLDDLLDVSRITRGSIELKKSSTELALIIGSAIDAARPAMDAKQHELSVELPAAPVYLDADAVRLTQVFANLLINAAKYTDPKGSIRVQAVRQGNDLAISIRDNGIGIAPEMLPRLFTLFTQARSALERSEGGLGVGLALVRGIVTLHGGRVEARSAGPNEGSEFVVHLPLGTPVPVAVATGAKPRTAVGALDVVIIDDNQDVADSCATLLELSGHRVRTAYSAHRGLELARDVRPEVMLLDIGLPDMSGYELASTIRATPWGRATILVAVTGWGQETDRERAFRSGFDHHLTKPISTDALESLLQSLRPLMTTAESI